MTRKELITIARSLAMMEPDAPKKSNEYIYWKSLTSFLASNLFPNDNRKINRFIMLCQYDYWKDHQFQIR